LNKTYTLEEIIREVNKVKIGDLREVAQEVFRGDKLNLALIGPVKKQENNIINELKVS